MSDRGDGLPGTRADSDDAERIVLHVDMDCFYAACERLREPGLEGEPVVVGMGYEEGEGHGAVATASYEARAFGVESAMGISKALELLPRKVDVGDDPEIDPDEAGHYRSVDMEYYKSVSEDVRAILHDCADVVREVSIDEAYLDVTDRTSWDAIEDDAGRRTLAEGFARHIKGRIEREVGVTASVGVAPNMSAAKIASDFEKPDGLTVVEPGNVREFLAPLDVEEIHGVGPVTARELRDLDVHTAVDLARADRATLVDTFGERGRELYARARGIDDREVTPTGLPKSLSRESAFTGATDDEARKRERVRRLAAAVADRARGKDARYRTIGIKVITPPYDVNTRERSLPGPIDDPGLVEEVALELLTEFEGDRVRKLGVRVSNLDFSEDEQASLDGFEAVADGEGDDERVETDGERMGDGTSEPASDSRPTTSSSSQRGQTSLTDFDA